MYNFCVVQSKLSHHLCFPTGARILWMLVRVNVEWTKTTVLKWDNSKIPRRWR